MPANPRRVIGSMRTRFSTVVGVSDRIGMPRIGKLRLGIKKKTDKGAEYPAEIDYFRCDPDAHLLPAEREKLLAKFDEVYGERATVLHDVRLPSNDPEFVIPHPLEWWASGANGPKLMCQGNGQEATRLNVETGSWEPRACCQVAQCAEWESGKKCGMKARLRIFLPLVTVSGYWQIDTSSLYGLGNILDVVHHLQTMFGRLTSIPLVLSREAQGITFEAKTTTHYVLHLRAPNLTLLEFRALLAKEQTQKALPPASTTLEIIDEEDDPPEELLPEEVQESAVDPALLEKIHTAYDILGTSAPNRAVALNRFKGREADLLRKILDKIDTDANATGRKVATA